MEPRLLRHGNFVKNLTEERLAYEASMEPRLLRHGNADIPEVSEVSLYELQWSHVFSDMEMPSLWWH